MASGEGTTKAGKIGIRPRAGAKPCPPGCGYVIRKVEDSDDKGAVRITLSHRPPTKGKRSTMAEPSFDGPYISSQDVRLSKAAAAKHSVGDYVEITLNPAT